VCSGEGFGNSIITGSALQGKQQAVRQGMPFESWNSVCTQSLAPKHGYLELDHRIPCPNLAAGVASWRRGGPNDGHRHMTPYAKSRLSEDA
jgi:hypothetical protein